MPSSIHHLGRNAAVALLLGTIAPAALAAPLYDLTILQPLAGDPLSIARSINNSGQVGGRSAGTPVVWTGETPTPYALRDGDASGQMFAINNTGTAAGISAGADAPARAVRWTSPSAVQQLVPEDAHAAGADSFALGISNAGTVVGAVTQDPAFESPHAFVWSPGAGFQALGDFGGKYTELFNVSAAGSAVGVAFTADAAAGRDVTTDRPIRWTAEGGFEELPLPEAASFGYAADINEQGQILISAGLSLTPSFLAAVFILDPDGSFTRYDVLPDRGFVIANAFNEAGNAVGLSADEDDPFNIATAVATLWTEEGAFDLNELLTSASDLRLLDARSINDLGQIVGVALDAEGTPFAFRLDPVSEPGSVMLFGLGAALLAMRRRRQS